MAYKKYLKTRVHIHDGICYYLYRNNMAWHKGDKFKIILYLVFLAYLAVLVKLVFFKYPLPMTLEALRGNGPDFQANLAPGRTIMIYLRGAPTTRIAAQNILGNILLFMPLGLLLPLLKPGISKWVRIALAAAVLALVLELLQARLGLGSFDIDDIILNTLGAALGCALFRMLNHFRPG